MSDPTSKPVEPPECGPPIPDEMTWADLVRRVGAAHGVEGISDEEATILLWEVTPWPVARNGPEIERALVAYFRG